MGKSTTNSWSEKSWNPVTGCTKISKGCRRCYAKRIAEDLQAKGNYKYRNGFNVTLHPDSLLDPLTIKKPHRIFVCSMSDLFHKDVPDQFIINVFDVMRRACHHTFLILTKRSTRLRLMDQAGLLKWQYNIWAGVSVENDKVYQRIDDLLATKAKVKWLSIEPLLGEVDISNRKVDWVVTGGESGKGSTRVDPDWVRKLRDQCLASNTPFLFKQWGGIYNNKRGCLIDGKKWNEYPVTRKAQCSLFD